MKRACHAALVSVLLASGMVHGAAPAPADAIEEARLALRTRQFAQAVDLLQRQSRAGSGEADYLLGLANWSGFGTRVDRAAARAALERAAYHDHARAQFALAALLAEGSPAERAAAGSWVRRAAQAGYTPAIAVRDAGRSSPLADPRADKSLGVEARFEIASFAARSGDLDLLRAVDAASLNARRDAFGRTLLASAVLARATDAAQLLLQSGAAAETADEFGITPLMLAAGQPEERLTSLLLAAGARVATRDPAGRDALNYAATANQPAQVRRLLAAGAKLDGVDQLGNNATDAAQRSQSAAALAVLQEAGGRPTMPASLARGAGIDATRTGTLYAGWPPLLVAASRDDAADIRRRVAAGAAVDAANARGETGLLVAVDARALNAVRALLELGADPRLHAAGGANALERAVRSGNGELLGMLLERASLSRPEGAALLAVAVQRGDATAAKLLIAHGAPPDEPDATGMRPLARAARRGDIELIKLLADRGAAPAGTDTRGRSARWYAAGARAQAAVDLLLEMHVPVDAADRAGVTPLLLAIRAGDDAVVRRLIEAGAPVDAKGAGRDPPLRVAADLGDLRVLDALLARKPDVDAADGYGETALMSAARTGNEAVCAKLLAAGAKPGLRGRDRATAADIAEARGFGKLAKLLRG
jgi:ankyrin repeat protein